MPEFEAALEELRRRSQPAPDVPADTTQQFVPNQTELDTEQDLELLRNQTSDRPDVQVETPRPAPKPLSSQELATDSLQNNLRHAAGVNPQEVAQRRKLANDLGVPKELLPDGPEAQEQLFLKQNDAAELMRSNPEIAAYLQDLDNAEVAGQDIGTLKKVSSLMRRFHLDPLVAAAKTTVAVPQTLAGIYKIYDRAVMSLIPDSVMKAVDDATPQAIREGLGNVEDQLAQAGIRLDFKQTQEFIDKFYSPETREAKEAVAKAEGFFGTLGTAVENPSAIATAIGESIGPMLLGGATAQVITKAFPAISPLVAGAAGEGVTIAGGTAQQITEETGEALTGQQALISAGTGVLGAGIGILGAKIAQKLGVGDLDTALARGSIEGAMVKSQVPAGLAKRILVGGGIEGMEELGQSGVEQIAQNIATEKPWNEGVPEAMAMGLLTGGVMGGTVQAFTPRAPEEGLNRDIDDAAVEALRNVAHAQQAEENKQTLEEFSKSVAESSLRANSPEEFKKFIRTMADEGEMISEVYVDAAKLDEAFAQSGITPEELQEKMPEVAKELALAKEVGSEVRISFDDYATHIAGGKAEVPLLDHLRTTPEGMTYAESQQFFQGQEKQLTEQAKEILETHQPVLTEKEFQAQEPEGDYQKYLKEHKNKAEVFAVDTKNVHQNILDGLNATGRFTKNINAVYAVPFREFYATAAAKEGILPSELYERMPLNFKNVRIEDGILDQPAGTFTSADLDNLTQEEIKDLLVVQHNLSAENLLHAHKMGGLAVPSVGIAKAKSPLKGFGDITLVGSKDLVRPSKDTQAFGADIYSPRYPKVVYDFSVQNVEFLEKEIAQGIELTGEGIDRMQLDDDPVNVLRHNPSVLAQYLINIGKKPKIVKVKKPTLKHPKFKKFLTSKMDAFDMSRDPEFRRLVAESYADEIASLEEGVRRDLALTDEEVGNLSRKRANEIEQHKRDLRQVGKPDRLETERALKKQVKDTPEFSNYVLGLIERASPKEQLFKGFTYSGNRRYIVHSLENVIKELKKNLRSGEGFNYGLGSIRSTVTPKFRSLEDIQKNRNRIVDPESFEAIKDEMKAKYDDLSEKLDQYHESPRFDTAAVALTDIAKMGIHRALSENGFQNVPQELKEEVAGFMDNLRSMPTEYFEVKLLRAVSLGEFSGAVVPSNTSDKVLAVLRDNGITDIRKYKAGDTDARTKAIAKFNDLFFQSGVRDATQEEFTGRPGGPTTVSGIPPLNGFEEQTKIRGRDGQPLTVFRGSDAGLQIDHFKKEALGFASGAAPSGRGVHFTTRKSSAAVHGDVREFQLDIRNPFVFKADDPKIPSHDTAEEYFEWREGLRAKGFDGIVEIASHLGGPNNIIAFDPEQVILKQGVFHQFAGARSDTADVFQLNRAIDLEAQGLDNDSIRLETGWFRGIDRKWRYEIDDSKATLKPIAEGKDTWLEIFDSTPDNITLGSLVDHPGLYAAYPALQDVVVGRTTGTGAQLIPSTERTPAKIEIGDQVPIGKVLSALMHEVQHALQEIEGFAFGTNTEHVKATAAAKIREASEAAKPVMRKIDKEVFAITERFIGGETEAVTQVEDAREKHKEVLGEGKSPSAYLRLEMMTREPTTANYLRVLEENQEAQNDPFNVYMRSAGEIEARNVETRLTLNEEGRRGFPPENTQDIPSSEAIVQFKGGVSSSLPPPANMFPQQPEQQIRAAYDPTNFTISLLKGADLSSVIHEGGHFYLEALADMAGQPNAVQQVKDDFRTTLNWFGINGDNPEGVWNMMTLEQKRQYHEQWAQSFERYNLEGKAPTTEMQPVFARFRAWMLQVYKSMKDFLKQNPLAGRLNDDIRQVFDRMLAADDAIKATEKAREYAPLFPNAEAAGVTPEEFQKYMEAGQKATSIAVDELTSRSLRDMKWLSNAKDRAIKSLQKEADAQRKIIREQVESEVMAEPINLARRLIRKGELVNQDGTVTKVTEHKLNTEDVKDLRPGMPLVGSPLSGMTKPGGLNPDLAAQFFGFDSGDALLEALLTEETAKEKIDGITDQRMLQEHGDLVDPTEIKRAAEKAIHNEARARFMATGLEMLAKQVGAGQGKGAVVQIAKAAKVAAENAISQKKVRELSPGQFEKAEAKANKEAIKQAAKDPKKAMEAQRAALLNNRLARAASEAKDEVDSALRYLKKFDSPNVRKQLTPDHLEQIDDLRANVDTRKGITNKQLDKRKSLQDWIDEQEANGFEPAIDPAVMDDLKRKHYKEMTVEELRGLVDSIKQIEHIARRLQKVFTARDKRKFQELVDDAWESIEDNANRTVPERGTPTDVVGVSAKWARRMAAEHRKFNSIIREMDGGKDNGKMWNLLSRGMNEAGDLETEMKQVATDKISELFAKLPKEKVVPGNIYSKKKMIPGTNLSMTQEQRIMFGMNWGNAGNRQRLLDGGMTGQRAISSKEADKVLDTLSKEEWDFIQGVWDYIATYKPQVAALEKKLTGVEPEWVEPTPVKTKFGTYRGGYFPAKYDTELSTRSESLEAATDLRMGMKGAFGSAATRSGYTKARSDEVKNRPLLLSYNVISQHVSEVTHRLAWQPWLIDVNRLLKALDAPIRKHYGQEILKELRDTTIDIAQGDAPAKNATEQAINRLRTGSTIVGLGWRVSTAILQITGLTQSMARIGSRWAAVGVGKYVKSPIDSAKFADEKSRLMRDRSKTMNREINEILNTIRAGEKVSAFTATYFTMIGKMQRIVDLPTWHGAYEKALHQLKYENALDEKTRKEIEDHAVALADQAVIDSQSGGHIKDLAKIQRGSPAWKLFTNFYSYFSAAYNLNIEAVRRTNFKSPSEVGLFAVDMLLINTVPTIMATALALAMKGGCDWEDIECIGKKLAQDQLGHFMGQMILLREMGAAISVATGGDGYGYQGPAGLRFFSDLYKAGTQINQGEADMPLFKAVNSTAGAILHYPAGQINSTVDGIRAIERGEVEGIQILPALISGPPKD